MTTKNDSEKIGKLFSIGMGPGDPQLVTVRGAEIIRQSAYVFVPTAKLGAESVVRRIAEPYLCVTSEVREVLFPMDLDREMLEKHWLRAAEQVACVLRLGTDACFLTLGDPLLYSTNIYLIIALRKILPHAVIEVVPGVPAFCAVAALTEFPVGRGKEPVTIVPSTDRLDDIRNAIALGGTVVLMKVGKRLAQILDLLEDLHVIEQAVFVSHAGMPNQRIESDLRKIRAASDTTGYLSIILIKTSKATII
jgi:precorrin-2/cobalt-factor-2 C20-methyltransferase